ncbi:uncharacterized protein LOC110447647 [Mizuhopecten yessoensis]|uniref:uncharacterized protein LOC110447647 n=1 Tax=Mizuhopecten yessoensis TaxID=6573 RepID=UPI000B45EB29|nr:uncharacterized protein LOC110447647 [Mizuhopecten yessoensis]
MLIRVIATISLIAAVLVNSGYGLMCYKCDNRRHPDICDRKARKLTVGHVENIERCNGTCKIAAMRKRILGHVIDVYMRTCDHDWKIAACNQTENASVCHCKDRDFCNYQLKNIPFDDEVRGAALTSVENSAGKLFDYRTTLNVVLGFAIYILYIIT